eukprot:NODE_555_length_2108_cov_58.694512_g512_i0.p1 GENE.NODE_555_length_2108_cov_58.694512_g512_i0~~NODE_555_length_2108_cov_58.694512_g512_i0.p1  ORF type:complete len:617 (-),score=147.28 NODE_555_length_2108_cov_58.694512_g512_i0:164-2014(-)
MDPLLDWDSWRASAPAQSLTFGPRSIDVDNDEIFPSDGDNDDDDDDVADERRERSPTPERTREDIERDVRSARLAATRKVGEYSIASGNGADPMQANRKRPRDEDFGRLGSARRGGGDSVISRQMAKMRTIQPRALPPDVEKKKNRGRRDIVDNNVHWSEKAVADMTERDWRIFREDFMIVTRGGDVPKPIRAWSESLLPDEMLDAIFDAGYADPSPIQMQTVPIGLSNRDVIGIAQTGSGKTAAFVIPMCCYIATQPYMTPEIAQDGPYAIVMAPARELAQQIEEEAARFARFMKQRVISIVGGVSMEDQAMRIRMGADMIIGTPGRLVDCIERKYLVLNQCNYVVLDEADRMIDMGFEPQVKEVLDAMPNSNLRPENEALEEKHRVYRQTFMFSATMPASVEKLAMNYLRRPIHVTIGEVGTPIDRIIQRVEWTTSEHQKKHLLLQLLSHEEPPIIIFCNQRDKVESLARLIEGEGYRVSTLRGGKSQELRSEALTGFKKGEHDILVATDVAARGIDVKNVTHVVNYDMPKTIEFYQHRIGRTGRAGSKGVAVSYLTPQDVDIMFDLTNLLKNCKQKIPKELSDHEASKAKPGSIEFATRKRKDTVIFAKKSQF